MQTGADNKQLALNTVYVCSKYFWNIYYPDKDFDTVLDQFTGNERNEDTATLQVVTETVVTVLAGLKIPIYELEVIRRLYADTEHSQNTKPTARSGL